MAPNTDQLPTVHSVVLGYVTLLIYALNEKARRHSTSCTHKNLDVNRSLCMMDFEGCKYEYNLTAPIKMHE